MEARRAEMPTRAKRPEEARPDCGLTLNVCEAWCDYSGEGKPQITLKAKGALGALAG